MLIDNTAFFCTINAIVGAADWPRCNWWGDQETFQTGWSPSFMLFDHSFKSYRSKQNLRSWQYENARFWCIKSFSHLAVHLSPPWQKSGWCRPCPEGFWRCVPQVLHIIIGISWCQSPAIKARQLHRTILFQCTYTHILKWCEVISEVFLWLQYTHTWNIQSKYFAQSNLKGQKHS